MKPRLSFQPFIANDKNQLCLPIVVSTTTNVKRYLFPIALDVVHRHNSDSENVTEADVINTLNRFWFPGLEFSQLPARQRNAILDSILNNDSNAKHLNIFSKQD